MLSQSREQIIGFVAFELDHRNPQAIEHFADQRQLLFEQIRRRGASGFVVGVNVEAKLRRAFIETNNHALRPLIGKQLDQHRGEAVDRVGDLP